MQRWKTKTRDWKSRHRNAGVENARLEYAGPRLQGWKTREKVCMNSQILLYMLLFNYSLSERLTHVAMCEFRERFTMLVLFLAQRMARPRLSRALVQCLLDYLRPSELIGLDWIGLTILCRSLRLCRCPRKANRFRRDEQFDGRTDGLFVAIQYAPAWLQRVKRTRDKKSRLSSSGGLIIIILPYLCFLTETSNGGR